MCIIWSSREQRMQEEAEAAELKKREEAILRQEELENYIKEKERQILLLQVSAFTEILFRFKLCMSSAVVLQYFYLIDLQTEDILYISWKVRNAFIHVVIFDQIGFYDLTLLSPCIHLYFRKRQRTSSHQTI